MSGRAKSPSKEYAADRSHPLGKITVTSYRPGALTIGRLRVLVNPPGPVQIQVDTGSDVLNSNSSQPARQSLDRSPIVTTEVTVSIAISKVSDAVHPAGSVTCTA